MADPHTPTDPKTTNNAGINITDGTYQTINSGTGVEFDFDGVSAFLLKNGAGASRTFTVTVPVPSGSKLDDIGSSPSSKTYAVAAGKTQYVKNADAFKDPTTGKVKVDVDGATCSIMAIKH